MPADVLFWVTLTILVGIYAIWWEEEKELRRKGNDNAALKRREIRDGQNTYLPPKRPQQESYRSGTCEWA